MAVIGSGETAAKSALELIGQNQNLVVDLYTQGPLTAEQMQVPRHNTRWEMMIRRRFDPDYREQSMEEYQRYGTPITPPTLLQLLANHREGRVQIYELGQKFDETTMAIRQQGPGANLSLYTHPPPRSTAFPPTNH